MAWNHIIGQERIKKIFQRAILENRIAHAYCLWGIEGIGKDALAIEFVKTISCSSPNIKGDTIEACDLCYNCKHIATLQYPNLELVYSLPTGKSSDTKNDSVLASLSDEQIQTINEQISIKAKNPYHKLAIPNANQIRIASIRDLKRKLAMSNFQEGRRFVIVFDADLMNTESANAFLKTLEEPHKNTTIIMTSSRQEQLLSTILSRCQQIQCQSLSDDDIATALQNRMFLNETEARLASAFAQGSYSKALEFLDEDMKQLRLEIVNILRTALKKNIFRLELLAYLDELIKQKDKKKVEKVLGLLIFWMRDALIIQKTNSTNNIINVDQADTISKFAQNFNKKDISLAIQKTENTINLINRNIQLQLALLTLFLSIRDIFLG